MNHPASETERSATTGTAGAPCLAGEERLAWLLAELGASGAVSTPDAARRLGVSEMTVRRDLLEIERRGHARRVRGGALPVGPQPFADRTDVHARAKGWIAAKLTPLIPSTGTIAFDASSTIMRAAATLDGATDLAIVTNGRETFTALAGRPGIRPVLTGGELDARTGSLVGPVAGWTGRQLTVSHFFCSAFAVSADAGATEITIEEADVKRSIATGAHRRVLAVDSSKLGHRATTVCLDWPAIDVLVTELDADHPVLAPYRSLTEVL